MGELKKFTYLRILNIFHNDFNRHFSSSFTGVITLVAINLIYNSIVAYELVHIFVYLIFPMLAFFCVFLLITFYPYIASWEEKSKEFLFLCGKRIRETARLNGVEKRRFVRQMKAMQPVRNQLSYFCYNSVDISKGCLDQIVDGVLLLLSF